MHSNALWHQRPKPFHCSVTTLNCYEPFKATLHCALLLFIVLNHDQSCVVIGPAKDDSTERSYTGLDVTWKPFHLLDRRICKFCLANLFKIYVSIFILKVIWQMSSLDVCCLFHDSVINADHTCCIEWLVVVVIVEGSGDILLICLAWPRKTIKHIYVVRFSGWGSNLGPPPPTPDVPYLFWNCSEFAYLISYHKTSVRDFSPGRKCCRCIGLTTMLPSWADCLKIPGIWTSWIPRGL